MTPPRWTGALLRRVAPVDRVEDLLGDLEETHRRRIAARGRLLATLITSLETVEMTLALLRHRRGGGVGASLLDFKLGVRMLVRYPGLTVVGGLAMAFAIWVGAGMFEMVTQVVRPRIPLDEGSRIVGLQVWDAAASNWETHTLSDFFAWSEALETVEELGAFRALQRNLTTPDGQTEPTEVAEISASAFQLARVRPLLGRALLAGDESPGAPAVVVIGHELWRDRFDGDADAIGRTVRIGATPATVVGVMPEGFAFPVAQNLWAPLRVGPLDFGPGEGPPVTMFGRLAPGATLAEARAELAALGARAAVDHPATHAQLRPEVVPYAESILRVPDLFALGLVSTNLVVVVLLVLMCGNVALLMFARAATRESELVVRNALGASRGRIVTQLFIEALVLGGLAAAVGLSAAGWGLRWVFSVVESDLLARTSVPFWFHPSLSATTIVYALLLTVLGAVIAGVLPALKVTGRAVGARLRQMSAGSGGLRFGGIWTFVIVTQVAVTVAFPVVVYELFLETSWIKQMDSGFPAEEYLAARIEMDREPSLDAPADTSASQRSARYQAAWEELARRVAADPAVAGVTFANRLPRMYHPHRLIEVDEGGAEPMLPQWPGYRVSSAAVDAAYFESIGVHLVAGRGFTSSDVGGAPVVIVNRSLARNVFGDRNPIGRRIRLVHFEEWEPDVREPGPWLEIVGVAPDMGMAYGRDPKVGGFYEPSTASAASPVQIAVHVKGDPMAFAATLRSLAAAADPALRVHNPIALDQVNAGELAFYDLWIRLTLTLCGIALVLSLAGIYAVMSFTVSRRTREIGIRTALGADRRRVAFAIFARPLSQVAGGVAIGGLLLTIMVGLGEASTLSPRALLAVFVYTPFMMAVCLLACVVPTRRALRIEPTEALRAEG